MQAYRIVHHILQGRVGQLLHFQKPLQGQFWLYHRICPLRVTVLVHDVLHLHQVAHLIQVFGYLFPHGEPVLPYIEFGGFAHGAVVGDGVYHLQVVP